MSQTQTGETHIKPEFYAVEVQTATGDWFTHTRHTKLDQLAAHLQQLESGTQQIWRGVRVATYSRTKVEYKEAQHAPRQS